MNNREAMMVLCVARYTQIVERHEPFPSDDVERKLVLLGGEIVSAAQTAVGSDPEADAEPMLAALFTEFELDGGS